MNVRNTDGGLDTTIRSAIRSSRYLRFEFQGAGQEEAGAMISLIYHYRGFIYAK